MRRRGRSVHRQRVAETTGAPDAVALALPGLVCGFLGIALVLYATTIRKPVHVVPLEPIVRAAPITSSLASPDSSSLAALTSALRSDRP